MNYVCLECGKYKTRQKRKFDTLLAKSHLKPAKVSSSMQDKKVVNLTDTSLNEDEKQLLMKGLNFVPTPTSVPMASFISSIESSLSKANLPNELISLTRKQVVNLLARSRPPPSNMPPNLRKALLSLCCKQHLVILPADKGRATVVMDKHTYESKMESMLSDANTYERLKRDPVSSLERQLNSLLMDLKKQGLISKRLFDQLRSSVGHTPYICGLPKVHKSNVPLCPIVSFYSSPTYRLSKHFCRLLSTLVGNTPS